MSAVSSLQQNICQVKITEIMSVLDSLEAAPRKSLGQNFLHDKNLASLDCRKTRN